MAMFEVKQTVYFIAEIEADTLEEAEAIASDMTYDDMDGYDQDAATVAEID